MIRIMIALMVGGGFLMFFGFKEMQLSSGSDSEPKAITAAELIANGPGDNAHVIISDFALLTHETLMLTPEDKPNQYDKVWAPVIPLDDPYVLELQTLGQEDYAPPYTQPVNLILYSKKIKNENELFAVAERDTVQGLIINKVDKLSGEELTEFQKSIKIDPATAWVLEVDRKPAGSGKVLGMLGGGLVLFLAGPGLFMLGRNK